MKNKERKKIKKGIGTNWKKKGKWIKKKKRKSE